MQSITIQIDEEQNNVLVHQAQRHGSSVSAEIKSAIDLYIELDQQSLLAQQELAEMDKKVDQLIKTLEKNFERINQICKKE